MATSLENSLPSQLRAYIEHLQTERQLADNSVKAYQRDLSQLATFCEAQHLDSWQQVQVHHIRGFVAQRHRKGASGKSIQRQLSSARSFFHYLSRELLTKNNPAVGVSAPRSQQKLPKLLDTDEIARLIGFAAKDWYSIRDRALFELIYSSGLRLAETVNTDLSHLDLEAGLVRVSGKGNKTRAVPVGEKAVIALNCWLDKRQQLPKKSPIIDQTALFLSDRGRRISPRNVQSRLRLWAQRMGIPGAVHPHMLRHSVASHLLESSGNLRAVQEFLGHADISTTQIYTHLDFQHLAEVYDKSHPKARRPKAR
jgi:integrase/recombinase XerC